MTRRRRKENANKSAIWMGVFVIVVMVASTLAIVFNNQHSGAQGNLDYNGYNIEFDVVNNRYVLNDNGQIHTFYYHPTELEYHTFDSASVQLINNAQYVFVSNDPNTEPQNLPYQDLFRFELSQSLNKQFVGAIQTENENSTFPVLTCANATINNPIIELNASTNASIFVDGACIIVNAQGIELLRMKDLLTYYVLGVMQDEE